MSADSQIHVCLNGQLYDLTTFSITHPGGPLCVYHKTDATTTFTGYHHMNFLQKLRPYHMGPCEPEKNKIRDTDK